MEANKFSGTRAAFEHLISTRNWYKDVKLNGIPITKSNAAQIKIRLKGNSTNKISTDYMVLVLESAGYKIIQPVIWQK